MDKRYFVDDFDHCLGHVVEECGEVCAAAGKLLRWGPYSYNPELPEDTRDRETNIDWLSREITDLQEALDNLECVIIEGRAPAKPEPGAEE